MHFSDLCAGLLPSLSLLSAACLAIGPAGAQPPMPVGAHEMSEHYAHAAAGSAPDIGKAWAETKHRDVYALYRLLDRQPPTTVALSSGVWSDPAVWSSGKPPASGASVWIPEGTRVFLTSRMAGDGPKLIRIDGTLAFSPDVDTRLAVGTVVVTRAGSLEIGSAAEPIGPNVEAEIVFTDHGLRDVTVDPFDLGGGLLAMGRLDLHGSPKTGVAVPAADLRRGAMRLRLDPAPLGWRVGDRLLVPGTDERRDQDEVIRIASLEDGGRDIVLDRQLANDRHSPRPGLIPIGNLSRNVVLRSNIAAPDARRAHVMVVHRAGGTAIDSVRFEELGRSRADIPLTTPALTQQGSLVPRSDDNPIGRYVLHFHNQIGADLARAPHRVDRSVFEGGPRHGLVNHGDHVVATGNVAFRIAGSQFFGENGTEIGAFIGNLAVRSSGSGKRMDSRMYTFEFGHGGHGFWMQGGGIELVGNAALGHAGSAFVVFGRPPVPSVTDLWFDRRNLRRDLAALDNWPERINTAHVPFTARGNIAAASLTGFEIWNHNRTRSHRIYSKVEDSVFWAMRGSPLMLKYTQRIDFHNVGLFGGGAKDMIGVERNTEVSDLRFSGMEIRGFRQGIIAPMKGSTLISGGTFDNDRDIVVDSPSAWGRRLTIEGTQTRSKQHVVLHRRLLDADRWDAAFDDFSTVFLDDLVLLDGRQVFFPDQAPDAIPFAANGPAVLRGLSATRLLSDYGLAVGGALAGRDAVAEPGVGGLVGSPGARLALAKPIVNRSKTGLARLVGYRLPDGRNGSIDTSGLDEGWQLVPVPGEGVSQTLLAMVDRSPPVYRLDPGSPTSICPSDLAYGTLVAGAHSDGNGHDIGYSGLRLVLTRYDLIDGMAVFPYEIRDNAGNVTASSVSLKVDAQTPCHGPNVAQYLQGSKYSMRN